MSSPKPTLLYCSHGYHKTTGSTKFFIELLEERYRVELLWDESWRDPKRKIKASAINAIDPDVVVFFQALPSRMQLAKIRCRNKIVIPMYDSVIHGLKRVRRRLRGQSVRMINFCAEADAIFRRLGFESMPVQYWPPPRAAEPAYVDDLSILFWIRNNDVGWPTLKALLGAQRPRRIVLRCAPDPGQVLTMPTAVERSEFNIEIIDGWLEKNEYLQLLASCNVYMAPRLYEGIGLSFLEAMAQGLAVVAPNLPTMNEYIRNNENGYLYDPAQVRPINFDNLAAVQRQALKDVAAGFRVWTEQKAAVLSFIAAPMPELTVVSRVLTWARRIPIIGAIV